MEFFEPATWEADPHATRLDISRLEQHVQHYLQLSLAKSTIRSYASSFRRYSSFCTLSGVQQFPTSESILCQFVAYLGQQQLKHQTIKCYLSSIRYFQIMQSYPDPFVKDMPRLQYVLRGIKYDEARKNQQSRQRLPVTMYILQKVYQVLLHNPTDFDNIMLWSAFLLCFFGFLRSGEITIPDASSYDPTVHLNFQNVSIDNPNDPQIM